MVVTPLPRRIFYVLSAFALVFGASVLPLMLAKHGLAVAPIWPANGLALVLAIRARRHDLPPRDFYLAIFIAILLANLVAGNSVAISLAFTAGNLAEIAAAYSIVRWSGWHGRAPTLPSGQTTFARVLMGAIVGPIIGATTGAACLVLLSGGSFASLWLGWSFSSSLSMLVVTSIGFALPIRPSLRWPRPGQALLFALVVLAGAATVLPAFATGRIALLVLTAPVIVGAAIRLRVLGAAVGLGTVSAMSLSMAGSPELASRFQALFSPNELVLLIQVYLVIQGLISLALATYLDERDTLRNVIKAQRELAENQAELRLQLLMNIAHEIRTPLNVVQGCSELLVGAGGLSIAQKDLLAASERAASQLQDLAVNLLDASRMESGLISFEPEAVDPVPILKDVAGSASLSARKPEASVTLLVPEDLRIWVDRLRFRQIATNLITNAMRYGAEYGGVIVRVTAGPDEWSLSVEDRGPGFRPGFSLEAVPATQALSTATKSGVGLSLVKQMVLAHGGTIWISSTPFVSTIVRVTLPAEGMRAALEAIERSQTLASAA